MRRMFRSSPARSGPSVAALMPLVDILTILLVAVLRTWSTQPPIQPVETGFELPISRSEGEPSLSLAIDVGLDGVYVNGLRAASSSHWSQAQGVLIPGLLDALQMTSPARVRVRAHSDAPWTLVSKVLSTAQHAGVGDVELVAISQASL
jgi:biopolymer transport protein ExbD